MTTKAKAKTSTATETAAETFETIANVGKETVETVISMSSEAAAEGYKNASAYGKDSMDAMKDGYDKMAASGKDNLDACTKAYGAAFAGFEAYYNQMLDYTKNAATQNADIVEKFYAVKTPQDLLDVQFEAMNNSVNRVIAQTTEMNKITTDMMSKTIAPIKAQVESSVEAFVKPYTA